MASLGAQIYVSHDCGRGLVLYNLYYLFVLYYEACDLILYTMYDFEIGVCHGWLAYVCLYYIIIITIVQNV